MDRPIAYTSEQGRSTDFLFAQRATMIGLGKLAKAMLGSSTIVEGLAVTPTTPAGLNVQVGAGQIYSMQPVDAAAYGALPADTSDTILKQGLLMSASTLATPAPTTGGYSINYLIQAAYQDQDTNAVVLPYFNSANPLQPLTGQNNSGVAQPTERQGVCIVALKAGAAATTGSQTTPAADAGYTALAVVTVANGQATVTSANITAVAGAPVITNLLQMLQSGSAMNAPDTGTANAYAVALTPAITALTTGQVVRFKALNTNTAASTLNVNGLGAVSITAAGGQALGAGQIVAGGHYEVIYSSAASAWLLLAQSAGAVAVANATTANQAIARGQVLSVSPVINSVSVTTPAANTTYTAAGSFTAPCNGYVIAWGSLAIAGTLTSGASISISTFINGIVGSADGNIWPLTTEYQFQPVVSGSAVTFNFNASTNATAPGGSIQLHVLAIFIPNP